MGGAAERRNTMEKPAMTNGLAALILAAGLCTVATAEDKEEAVKLAQVPAAAQGSIKKLATEKEIKKVERSIEDGKVAYEVEVARGGRELEFKVSADGKLLSLEEVVALTEVPEAVRKAFSEQAGDGTLGKVERITEDGRATYETKVMRSGRTLEITVAPDGKLLGTEDVTGEKD